MIKIDYKFKSWNDIINTSRKNIYLANKCKQEETEIARLHFLNKKYNTPIEIIFYWHMKSKIADIDGRSNKNIIDGIVKAGCIKDDNVKYIKQITNVYVEDTRDYVEINIKEL